MNTEMYVIVTVYELLSRLWAMFYHVKFSVAYNVLHVNLSKHFQSTLFNSLNV